MPPLGDAQLRKLRPRLHLSAARSSGDGATQDLGVGFGLHPAFSDLLPMWRDKNLAVVHAVGSPDSTRSHFDAQDYMESGMPGVKVVSSGWMNRMLKELPASESPLRAINIGSTMPRILSGTAQVASYAPKGGRRRSAIDNPYVAEAFEQMYTSRRDALGTIAKLYRTVARRLRHTGR